MCVELTICFFWVRELIISGICSSVVEACWIALLDLASNRDMQISVGGNVRELLLDH